MDNFLYIYLTEGDSKEGLSTPLNPFLRQSIQNQYYSGYLLKQLQKIELQVDLAMVDDVKDVEVEGGASSKMPPSVKLNKIHEGKSRRICPDLKEWPEESWHS